MAQRGRGCGGAGHSAAIIASNSSHTPGSSISSTADASPRMGGADPPGASVMASMTTPVQQGQALMACRSSPLLAMAILRGFACSATGISKVSTPAS